ncbi:MAG: VIT1/CCC1 transporter family protein [Planctomycetota bacterium]|jgi:VIT1/CCC1 family predicted Fe2+/Mn2+ transporter
MRLSIRKGFSFGLTSGVITTLGLIVGLHSSTHSALIIIGGILVIAIADACSDALGIHISEEYENKHTTREIWEATVTTFLSKFIVTLTFIIPVLLFPLYTAMTLNVIWGLSVMAVFSFYMAREQGASPYLVVIEHLAIAVFVIILTHYVGDWVAALS